MPLRQSQMVWYCMSFLSLHDAAGMSEQGWLLMLLLMLLAGWLCAAQHILPWLRLLRLGIGR